MMKDEEVEKLLRVMPLKKPVRMPETLSERPGAGRRGWAALGRVVRCRVPAWQAAAAAMLAVALYASAGSLFAHAGKEAVPTHRSEFGLPTKVLPPDSDATVAAASSPVGPHAANGTDNKTIAAPRNVVVAMALTNPGAAMQSLQFAPLMSNGQMQGVTIANVATGSLAVPYLASGDQILAVNGTPINSMTSAVNICQQLLSGGSTSVTVTMERDGQRQNVVYSIQ
jgi:hypothetical protein